MGLDLNYYPALLVGTVLCWGDSQTQWYKPYGLFSPDFLSKEASSRGVAFLAVICPKSCGTEKPQQEDLKGFSFKGLGVMIIMLFLESRSFQAMNPGPQGTALSLYPHQGLK